MSNPNIAMLENVISAAVSTQYKDCLLYTSRCV